jgi:hypothetical protein
MQTQSAIHTTTIQLNLTESQLVKVAGPVRIGVAQGTLWVTQAGHTQDLVLRAGDTLEIARNSSALVEAQAAAQVQVMQARHGAWVVGGAVSGMVAEATRQSWAGLARRLADSLRGLSLAKAPAACANPAV